MKNLDLRSALVGFLACLVLVGVTAATREGTAGPADNEPVVAERYQLVSHEWRRGTDDPPRLQDREYNNLYLTGLFRIDTSTGKVWALTMDTPDANIVDGWTLIRE